MGTASTSRPAYPTGATNGRRRGDHPDAKTDDGTATRRFEVTVTGAISTTMHEVTVSQSDLERLGSRVRLPEELVRASFEFLLAREPNEEILRAFDLSVIARYFPEFDEEITEPR